MVYLMLIPIFVVIAYGGILIYRHHKTKSIIICSLIVVLDVIFFFVLKQHTSMLQNLRLVLLIDTLIMFSILRLYYKVTVMYVTVFIVTISLTFLVSFRLNDSTVLISFIIALVFILAENNQLMMKKSYETIASEYQNKILNKQVEEVQNIYLTMRSWRHDYHNHLQKLKAHISMDQISEANIYLNELEIDLDNVNKLMDSGNVNLDAILNSKLSLAINNNISIEFKAMVPKELSITDIDLCVLIGNLIDNAVEACEKIEDKLDKFIRLYIGIFKEQLYISVSNSTNEIIRKMDEEYITTKRGNHGHGLKRINNIVNKYDGYINRQNEPKVFVTEVLLPL